MRAFIDARFGTVVFSLSGIAVLERMYPLDPQANTRGNNESRSGM